MLNIGDTIRGYRIDSEINRGAFCDAFKVSKGGKSYFLKEYSDPTELSKDFKDFLDNQKVILGALNSLGDSVETVVEHFVQDSHYYQVKKLLSGCDLDGWMERNTDESDRLEAALQLTRTLQAVHQAGIVHQDLKPGQVMVVSESPLKLVLTDFDWSVPHGKVVRKVATPWYGYVDEKPTEKSDIFTLGIIICILLTGANPYQECNGNVFDEELWPRWVSGRHYDEPIVLNPDISRKMNTMILSCLSPEPEVRPSMEEILSVLEHPTDIKRRVALSAGGKQLIIPAGSTAGRGDFKLCFPEVTDSDGNPAYMYVSHDVQVLGVQRRGDDLALSAPQPFSNYFLLNGTRLGDEAVMVSDGDRLELFSSKKEAVVASFTLEVK